MFESGALETVIGWFAALGPIFSESDMSRFGVSGPYSSDSGICQNAAVRRGVPSIGVAGPAVAGAGDGRAVVARPGFSSSDKSESDMSRSVLSRDNIDGRIVAGSVVAGPVLFRIHISDSMASITGVSRRVHAGPGFARSVDVRFAVAEMVDVGHGMVGTTVSNQGQTGFKIMGYGDARTRTARSRVDGLAADGSAANGPGVTGASPGEAPVFSAVEGVAPLLHASSHVWATSWSTFRTLFPH